MAFLRKLLGAVASGLVAFVSHKLGQPPEVTAAWTESARQVFVTDDRAKSGKAAMLDAPGRVARVEAFTQFGASTLLCWHAAGTAMTNRRPFDIQVTIMVWRAGQRFHSQMTTAAAALSSVFLLGSPETKEAALTVFETLGQQLSALGKTKQGSHEAAKAFSEGSTALGEHLAIWRSAAREELES